MERAYLQQLLHNKIKQKENERLSDHAQSVKDTKQEQYREEQAILEKQRAEEEELKKQRKREKKKEKLKRQKERKKQNPE